MKKTIKFGLVLSCMAFLFTCVAAPDNIKQKKSDETSFDVSSESFEFVATTVANYEFVADATSQEFAEYTNLAYNSFAPLNTFAMHRPPSRYEPTTLSYNYTATISSNEICRNEGFMYIKRTKPNYRSPFVDTKYVWELQHQINC